MRQLRMRDKLRWNLVVRRDCHLGKRQLLRFESELTVPSLYDDLLRALASVELLKNGGRFTTPGKVPVLECVGDR